MIDEFIDKDHKVMNKYYDIMDKDLSDQKLISEMRKLIAIDEDFYDPYLIIVETLSCDGKYKEAKAILKDVYERAAKRITDSRGRWPKIMSWGFLENRHIMRTLEYYADECWNQKSIDAALDIYRRLLQVNPNDNQGVRYKILAIRMKLKPDTWSTPFEIEEAGVIVGLDGIKVSEWFHVHAKKFKDEFESFFSFHCEE